MFDAELGRRPGGFGDVDGYDSGERRHYLARLLLVEFEDTREHQRLVGSELSALERLGDQQLQVLRRAALLERGGRIDAKQPQDRVRGPIERGHEGSKSPCEPVQGAGDGPGHRFGAGNREEFWDLLADRDVQRGGEHIRDREADREREPVREGATKPGVDQLCDGRLAEKPDPDRGERDAKLAR